MSGELPNFRLRCVWKVAWRSDCSLFGEADAMYIWPRIIITATIVCVPQEQRWQENLLGN